MHVDCVYCLGDGVCRTCGGEGTIVDDFGLRASCDTCNETGSCPHCRGTGVQDEA